MASGRIPACLLLFGTIATLLACSTLAAATPADTKVAPVLREALSRMREAGVTRERAAALDLQAFSTPSVRVDRAGRLQVYVEVNQVDDQTLRDLQEAGLAIDLASPSARIVQGWVPFDRVDALASLSSVRRVRAPDYAVPRSESSARPAAR